LLSLISIIYIVSKSLVLTIQNRIWKLEVPHIIVQFLLLLSFKIYDILCIIKWIEGSENLKQRISVVRYLYVICLKWRNIQYLSCNHYIYCTMEGKHNTCVIHLSSLQIIVCWYLIRVGGTVRIGNI
jgi:hypothetical protein